MKKRLALLLLSTPMMAFAMNAKIPDIPSPLPDSVTDWSRLNLHGKVKSLTSVTRTFEYDPKDGKHRATGTDMLRYRFDAHGRLVWFERKEDGTLTDFAAYEFDADNRMVHSTDKTGVYHYFYESGPDGLVTVTKKDAKKPFGKKTKLIYDMHGRLLTADAARTKTQAVIRFSGNVALLRGSPGPLVIDEIRDEKGRVIRSGANSHTPKRGDERQYDARGNLVSIYDHDTRQYDLQIDYTYDRNGSMRKKTARSHFEVFYYEYDTRGNETLFRKLWNGDRSRPPVLDKQLRTHNTYDTHGNLTHADKVREDDGKGQTLGNKGFDKNFKEAGQIVESTNIRYEYF